MHTALHAGGEAHAPAQHDLVRLPMQGADDYAAAPARVACEGWDYEAARDVADTGWAAVAGRRRGATQRAAVVRPARVLAFSPVVEFAPLDPTDIRVWGAEFDESDLVDAYSSGYADGHAVAMADARRAA